MIFIFFLIAAFFENKSQLDFSLMLNGFPQLV